MMRSKEEKENVSRQLLMRMVSRFCCRLCLVFDWLVDDLWVGSVRYFWPPRNSWTYLALFSSVSQLLAGFGAGPVLALRHDDCRRSLFSGCSLVYIAKFRRDHLAEMIVLLVFTIFSSEVLDAESKHGRASLERLDSAKRWSHFVASHLIFHLWHSTSDDIARFKHHFTSRALFCHVRRPLQLLHLSRHPSTLTTSLTIDCARLIMSPAQKASAFIFKLSSFLSDNAKCWFPFFPFPRSFVDR